MSAIICDRFRGKFQNAAVGSMRSAIKLFSVRYRVAGLGDDAIGKISSRNALAFPIPTPVEL